MTCGYCGGVMTDDTVESHYGMACVRRVEAERDRLAATLRELRAWMETTTASTRHKAACLLAKGITDEAHDLYQRAMGMDDALAWLDAREEC